MEMALSTSRSDDSDQWKSEEPREGSRPHSQHSHYQLSADGVTRGSKLWTPKRASWAAWLLSSLAMSFVYTLVLNALPPLEVLFGSARPSENMGPTTPFVNTTEPTSRAPPPLAKRAACQSGRPDAAAADSDLALRVGAVFVILAVSSAACAFPLLAARLPGLRIPDAFFFAVRHFGTGVLLATAFVHLLPTAFTLLGDPCLGGFWTRDFAAMPGAVALLGIFVVTGVEMLLHPARRAAPADGDGEEEEEHEKKAAAPAAGSGVRAKRPVVGRSESIGRTLSHINRRSHSGDAVREPARREENGAAKEAAGDGADAEAGLPAGPPVLSEVQRRRKDVMQIGLLEMGILFHSVFIGMALSVSIGGNEFVVLLIAIAFHRKIAPSLPPDINPQKTAS